MIKVVNKTDQKPKVEILTDIGESFWSEGVTAQSISNDIKQIEGDFDLVIGSLGGDVHEALMIHDLIKLHKGKVSTEIVGMTASSGTIIALAGDSISMSKNALFLVHNAWTMAAGNTHDFQKVSDDLDVIDGRIAGIYSKKTGKRKSQMLSLMEKEEWLSSEEAKEWGFIDKVFEPATPIHNSVFDKINNSKLPKINNMDTKPILDAFNELKALILNKKPEDVNETDYNAKVDELQLKFNALKDENETLTEEKGTLTTQLETFKNQAEEAVAYKAIAVTEKETAILERDSIKANYTEYAKAKLDRAKCEELGVEDFAFLDDGKVESKEDQERRKTILGKKTLPSIKDEPKA